MCSCSAFVYSFYCFFLIFLFRLHRFPFILFYSEGIGTSRRLFISELNVNGIEEEMVVACCNAGCYENIRIIQLLPAVLLYYFP